jgi:hypothetical protein
MDYLEACLQCFDEKHRRDAKESYWSFSWASTDDTEHMQRFFLNRAFHFRIHDALHKLIDLGCGRTPESEIRVENYPFDSTIRLMYDRGFTSCKVRPSQYRKLQRFLDCRDRARSVAIAVLGCFSHGRSAAVGEKDVGKIIGRAIWASRGIKEWMN